MKADYIKILNELKDNIGLMNEIDLKLVLTLLKSFYVINQDEEHILLNIKGPIGGLYELVGIVLPKKADEDMELFIKSLKIAGSKQSYEFVLTGKKNVGAVATREVTPVNVTSSGDTIMSKENEPIDGVQSTPLVRPWMVEAQEHLSTLIIKQVDCMAKIWGGSIHCSKIREAFVSVQVLEDYNDGSGKAMNTYHELFENDSKIVIEGDPGCGKSTYVNNIALEWANGRKSAVEWANKDKYLRGKFDLVFLLVLQTFDVTIQEEIHALLPAGSVEFVEKYFKEPSSKVLLILDGFEDFPEDSKFNKEVKKMLNGQLSQFYFFTIVVTTRRSHVHKLPPRFRARSLLIKGFNDLSMKQFLNKQGVPDPDAQTDSNLVNLLHNPLFCTIYCSLHYDGVNTSKLKDSYDFIKAFVDNAVKKKKNVTVAENEEQLKLLGAFAFQKLNSETLNVVDKLFSTFFSQIINVFKKKPDYAQRSNPVFENQLGLLIKKKIPVADGGSQDEIDFSHQLVVEYLAARYFVRHSLMRSQRKKLQPEKLADPKHLNVVRKLVLSSPSSLPFIRFLLFEYVNSNFPIPDDENARKLIFEYLSDEFSFICYFKSNNQSETRTINDITSLDCRNIDREIRHDSRFFPTLIKCHNLTSLNLARCNLSTHEANKVVQLLINNSLPMLTKFDLSHNSNVGSTPSLFPALGKCNQLERLDLWGCDLSIDSINRLTTCIEDKCWMKLSQLVLSSNSNVGSAPALFAELGKCKQLQRFDLGWCDLSIESINRLTTYINNCWVNLSQLGLSGNSNVGSTPALFTALGKCEQLVRLDLQVCDLSIDSINRLTTCIDNNCWKKLSQLGLSGNSNVGLTFDLFAALHKCEQLERLDLQVCDLSIDSINRLTTCIDNNCWEKLSQLGLSGNSNVGLTPDLFTALGKCKQLERLDLQVCDLSTESINRLTTYIDNNCWEKLSQLGLSGNGNVGSAPDLFTALGKCKQLQRLDLQGCYLTIESINRLTTCIDNKCWEKLSQLGLSSNSNVGSAPDLFTALGKCKQLQRLDLQGCYLTIESINRLTTCIDNCWVKLSQLVLSWNSNIGSTPALFTALGKCKQLERLDLQVCDLSIESINRLKTCIYDNCWPYIAKIDK